MFFKLQINFSHVSTGTSKEKSLERRDNQRREKSKSAVSCTYGIDMRTVIAAVHGPICRLWSHNKIHEEDKHKE